MADSTFHLPTSKAVAIPAMRHRVILNFEGEAEGITTDLWFWKRCSAGNTNERGRRCARSVQERR